MTVIRRHWRPGASFLVGLLVWGAVAAMRGRLAPSIVYGADAGAAVYILTTGAAIWRDGEAEVRRRAAEEDPQMPLIMALVVGAMAVSLFALIVALKEGRAPGHASSPWLAPTAVVTLVESWLVVQMLFCIHYAHMYFGDADDDRRADRGVRFQGEPPSSYRDFWYMAVCMGATFQVSDFSTTTSRFRGVITVHALVAFAFNTLVLALGVGIVGGLLG